MSDWLLDVRHAARSLGRTPGFASIAVGLLGLAIGATAALFSVVNAVLIEELPYSAPDRLVHIAASAPGSEFPGEFGVAPEFLLQYRESKLIEDVSTYNSFTSTLRTADRVERVRTTWPTHQFFSTLGVKPILGRLPTAADEENAVVLSYSLWTSWFGRDPAILGRTLQASGADRTVIGVMGPEFQFPTPDTLLWISNELVAADIEQPGRFGSPLVARLKPGVTPQQLADELTTLARRLPERWGGTPGYARMIEQHHRAVVRPLEEQVLGLVSRPLWVLLAATAIVLLIACANVANLFLVRAEGRHREMAMRRALGAARGRLVRLQMAEALVVAAFAALVALVLATGMVPLFAQVAPDGIPRLDRAGVDGTTLAFTAATALVAAAMCGFAPALRGSAPDLTRLRDGGRGTTGRRHWLRHGLVIGQTALALVLLIGAGLLMRSVSALQQVDPGYTTEDIFTFQIAPERAELKDAQTFAQFNFMFMERLAALPGVESVGLVENVPLNEGTGTMRVRVEGSAAAEGEGPLVSYNFTAGDYFGSMDIGVLAGRVFTTDDHTTARGNVIVSKSMAERLWPGQDPLGKRLQRQGGTTWETVVGVVEDVIQNSFQQGPEASMYFPMVDPTEAGGRAISSPAWVVKTKQSETIAPTIRALVAEVAPEAPMYRTFTMRELVEISMQALSFTLLTLGMASVLALVLGAVGLYAVLSYIVAERTREIGVRMALGARAQQVRRMFVAQGARVIAAGIALGIGAALAFTRALDSLLYGVAAIDVATFGAMALAMAAVGLLASYVPARRASNLEPVESLRRD